MSAAKREKTGDSTSAGNADTSATEQGKGRATPSRKAAQAANARPIVGSKDKAVRREQRKTQADARERARLGMMAGDERYLTPRDKGPQRRFVREYVDARWNVGELMIPVMLLFLVVALIPGYIQVYSIYFVWGFLFLAIIDAVILGFLLKKRLATKFGADNVQGGYRWYAAMRALQFRSLRMPKPQNKRGQYPN